MILIMMPNHDINIDMNMYFVLLYLSFLSFKGWFKLGNLEKC